MFNIVVARFNKHSNPPGVARFIPPPWPVVVLRCFFFEFFATTTTRVALVIFCCQCCHSGHRLLPFSWISPLPGRSDAGWAWPVTVLKKPLTESVAFPSLWPFRMCSLLRYYSEAAAISRRESVTRVHHFQGILFGFN